MLESLTEPLSATDTAAQAAVREHLQTWEPTAQKELQTLKEPGMWVSITV